MRLRDLISEEGDAAGTVAADIATVAFPLFVGGRNRKEKFRHGRKAVGMKRIATKSYVGQGIYEDKPGEETDYDEITHSNNLIHWPQGTTLVKVSDVYDWYKIGQTISDLSSADPAKFGKGPPQTIIVFGSEAEEHKLLPYLKRLGLGLTDIDDPVGEGYLASDLIRHFEKETTA